MFLLSTSQALHNSKKFLKIRLLAVEEKKGERERERERERVSE